MKKVLKVIALLLLVVVVVALGYVAYVFIDYHRLPDTDVATEGEAPADAASGALQTGERYEVVTWNLGFGAYSDDYGFFMDGGTESWAFSKEAVFENIGHAAEVLKGLDAPFKLLQEVDIGSTRTYQVDEAALLTEAIGGYDHFAQNYDSPFLFYPFRQPHGKSRSGLLTLSDHWIARRARVGLPVETSMMKLLDLDRCYSKAWIPVENGKSLLLYNLHLSAYTSDGVIAQKQLELLVSDMLTEREGGNYVVCGGDFNKDLLGNSAEVFGVSGVDYTWCQPIPEGTIPEGLTLVNSLGAADPIPSNRIADGPYVKGKTFVSTLDGFIVSDNVKALECRVVDEGFKCSDHNPVVMAFELIE